MTLKILNGKDQLLNKINKFYNEMKSHFFFHFSRTHEKRMDFFF